MHPRPRRLRFEPLEERRVLATAYDDLFSVIPGSDTEGDACGNDDYVSEWEDTDSEGNPVTSYASASFDSPPANLSGDPCNFVFSPGPEFSGYESYSYTIGDNSSSSTATVTFESAGPSAEPDGYSVEYNTTLTIPDDGVLANDWSPAGLQLTAYEAVTTAHGLLALNAEGGFSYTPAQDFFGDDSFTYIASDALGSSAETTVTINVIPPDLAISSFTTSETELEIDYEVLDAEAGPFAIELYASSDGVTLDQLLQTVDGGPDMGAPGPHSLVFSATFADLLDDYQLVAVLDSENDVPEWIEENNQAVFTGLSFPLADTSGPTVLSIAGTAGDDVIDVTSMGTDSWLVISGPAPELDPPASGSGLFYDVDGDGKVTRRDAQAVAYTPTITGFSWQNPVTKWDVNNDGNVTPSDALAIINWTNSYGWFIFTTPRGAADPYYDVSGDNTFSQLDYDMVVDKLNGNDGELESAARNTANPLDVDNDAAITDTDITAILDYLAVDHAVYHDLALEQIKVRAAAGNDIIIARLVTDAIPLYFYGGVGNDTLIGGSGENLLSAADGNNTIIGGSGPNTIEVGDGNNGITATDNEDLIIVGNGDNTISAGDGDDYIYAGDGTNTISGGDGNDIILAGNGDNTLQSGDGDDSISVGTGVNNIDDATSDDTIATGVQAFAADGTGGMNWAKPGTTDDLGPAFEPDPSIGPPSYSHLKPWQTIAILDSSVSVHGGGLEYNVGATNPGTVDMKPAQDLRADLTMRYWVTYEVYRETSPNVWQWQDVNVLLVYHKRYNIEINRNVDIVMLKGTKLSLSEKTAEIAIAWYTLADGELPKAEGLATSYVNAHWPTGLLLPPRLPKEPIIWLDGGWGPWGPVK